MRKFADQNETSSDWSIAQSKQLYRVHQWGKGYFDINKAGHVSVCMNQETEKQIDLMQLVEELRGRDLSTPLLLRFTDVLRNRLREIADAFTNAKNEFGYKGRYSAVYPIKVNQQRHVVEEVIRFGKEHGFGVEAGSKPELLAVLALVDDDKTPIVCNGFKDRDFIEAIILASKIGRDIIPVVEKLSELQEIIECSKEHGVRPRIGIRVKLSSTGDGKWEESGGMRSKFGLFVSELLDAIELLRQDDMLDCLQLLHSHIGSQLSNVNDVKRAVNELSRIYCEITKAGVSMRMIDVGGGFGVDYDGSQTSANSSTNYSPQEYANNIIFHIKEACDEAGIDHPTIISESGRAMVAYSSVLVFDILGWSGFKRFPMPEGLDQDEIKQVAKPIQTLYETFCEINQQNYVEYFHDAQIGRDEALSLFNLGYCTLKERGLAERLFFGICSKVLNFLKSEDDIPEEFSGLEGMLADTYFINGSVFQSLPDSWAIDQLFPIMPIHRLDKEPTCLGKLVDITCDSDGRIEKFISQNGTKDVLELHALTGEPYYVGVFLVGAYQEILGDMHNLFGDTNAVHISLDEQGEWQIDEVIDGDTVGEVLQYVQYDAEELKRSIRNMTERAIREKRISLEEGKALRRFYESGLAGSTYLDN
ncbi:biosynthetic arginine decarboxylase [Planctomycetota bacterium]|nr:biosynthetic arginine decarboxylase [Planctomycetota bacterium]